MYKFLTSHSKEAIDKILKCAPEMRKDMAVYTLSKVNEKSVARGYLEIKR